MTSKYNIDDEVFIIQSKWIYSENYEMPIDVYYVNKRYKISEIIIDVLNDKESVFYSFDKLSNGKLFVKEEYIFIDEFEAIKRCNMLNIQEIKRLEEY